MKKTVCHLLLIIVAVTTANACDRRAADITFGISPYQDTYLPKLAEAKGWFDSAGIRVRTVEIAWGDVMNSVVASGGADVAITNFNSFLAAYPELSRQGAKPVFYYPLFVFKGPAILFRENASFVSVSALVDSLGITRDSAAVLAAAQLRGKHVITTQSTEMEQIVLAAAARVGLAPGRDFQVTHASPEDGLAAFLGGEGDFYSGGLTERFRAQSQRAGVLLESADVNPPVIDGLVTTEQFARQHPAELRAIIQVWFRTVQYMESDLSTRTPEFLNYLNAVASTRYDAQQYIYAWTEMEDFFSSPAEVADKVLAPSSIYSWKATWDSINVFLQREGDIAVPAPPSAFWAPGVHQQLTRTQ